MNYDPACIVVNLLMIYRGNICIFCTFCTFFILQTNYRVQTLAFLVDLLKVFHNFLAILTLKNHQKGAKIKKILE